MLTRLSLARDAEAIAAKREISLLPFGDGCHSPLSKEARISSSSFFSLSILTLLIKINASGFPARDDRFQEDLMLRLHKRHQISELNVKLRGCALAQSRLNAGLGMPTTSMIFPICGLRFEFIQALLSNSNDACDAIGFSGCAAVT